MKIPKLKQGDKIMVAWIDSFTPTHSNWMDGEEINEHLTNHVLIETLGTYIGHDKRFMHLCASVAKVDGEFTGFLNPLTIPIGCIEKVKKMPV